MNLNFNTELRFQAFSFKMFTFNKPIVFNFLKCLKGLANKTFTCNIIKNIYNGKKHCSLNICLLQQLHNPNISIIFLWYTGMLKQQCN